MSVREKGIISRRIAQSYLSSVISISLVLFLVGGAAMVISNAKSVSDYFRENMKISAELSLSADETSALSLAKKIEGMNGIKSVEYISREQGIREMEEQLGSGFLDVFETPPIPISLEISLDAAYVEADSLKIIEEQMGRKLKADSLSCTRLVSHLYYMLVRARTGEGVNIDLNDFMEASYPRANETARMVCEHMEKTMGKPIAREETGFLAVHIQRAAV